MIANISKREKSVKTMLAHSIPNVRNCPNASLTLMKLVLLVASLTRVIV